MYDIDRLKFLIHDMVESTNDTVRRMEARLAHDIAKMTRQIDSDAAHTFSWVRAVAHLGISDRLANAPRMIIRPTRRVRKARYELEWMTYRVNLIQPMLCGSYLLFTDDGVELPNADCVVSVKVYRSTLLGIIIYRQWLWRDLIWEAVDIGTTPSIYQLWCWVWGRNKVFK